MKKNNMISDIFHYHPLFSGIISGIMVNNISLGLISAGYIALYWGDKKGKNIITALLVFFIHFTGNINFELVFIFLISCFYLLESLQGYNLTLYLIISLLLFIVFIPIIKIILGYIPAGVLNYCNISGIFVLFFGIFMAIKRESTESLLLPVSILSAGANFLAFPGWFFCFILKNKDFYYIKDNKYLISFSIILSTLIILPGNILITLF